jgi:hypothetical protein
MIFSISHSLGYQKVCINGTISVCCLPSRRHSYFLSQIDHFLSFVCFFHEYNCIPSGIEELRKEMRAQDSQVRISCLKNRIPQTQSCCCQERVDRVLEIPLPNNGQPDFTACSFTNLGVFSVSSYHVEWKAEHRRRTQRGDGLMVLTELLPTKFGRKFGNQCAAEDSNLHWHGIVPCLCTLTNTHIRISVNCPVCTCTVSTEDLNHMLMRCQRIQEIWQGLDY